MLRTGWVVALVLIVTASGSMSVAAQDADLATIGEHVLQTDPEQLVTDLQETPIRNAVLPNGFNVPADGNLLNQDLVDSFTSELGDVDGSTGTANVGVDVDRTVMPAAIAAGVVTYIVFDDEITPAQFRKYETNLRQAFQSDPSYNAQIEKISLGGANAVHVSVGTEEDGISVVVDIVSMPVGNVIVLSTVVLADQGTVDPTTVEPHNRDLALAGAAWLGSVAEHGSSPASPAATPDSYRDKFGWREGPIGA